MNNKLFLIFSVATVLLAGGGLWLRAMPPTVPVLEQAVRPSATASSSSNAAPALAAFATSTHTVGVPTAMPMQITVGTSSQVTVTVQITDPALIPNSANLLRLGAPGTQPTILGVMQSASTGYYTLQHTFNEGTPGQIALEVSAAFQGSLQRVLSSVVTISVWNVLNPPGLGFAALYPPTLYFTNSSTVGGFSLFSLDSSPGGVAIGGALPSGSSETQTGYGVRIAVIPYAASGTFDINQYLSIEYPNSAADVSSIASVSIGGQAGYEFTFQNEEGGGQPRAITYYNGNVYEISYVSTNYLPGFSDTAGLNTFNSMLQNFTLN